MLNPAFQIGQEFFGLTLPAESKSQLIAGLALGLSLYTGISIDKCQNFASRAVGKRLIGWRQGSEQELARTLVQKFYN